MSFLCLSYDKEKTFCPIVQSSNQGGLYFSGKNFFKKYIRFLLFVRNHGSDMVSCWLRAT